LFRAGTPPEPALDGVYVGGLAALNIAPVFTQVAGALIDAWLPWQGKTFNAAACRGDNVFTSDSLPLAHVLWPFYRDYRLEGRDTYRAFQFRTYYAPGLADSVREAAGPAGLGASDDGGPPPGAGRRGAWELAGPSACEVLKIDYDLDSNPRLSIRRVLDELVQVAPGEYLGKAHLRWWWGAWQTVAFFTLRK
jgi:hypothetical protein